MPSVIFFFDTYALFEIIRGNPKYHPYEEAVAVTTVFNLAELNYGLKKEMDETKANDITERFASTLTVVTVDDIKEAMSLRIRQKDLSIPDAIGYTVAQRLRIKFLTGDGDFEHRPDVEFVKK